MPNSHIINSLTTYIENPDPRYALLLKGMWGCGKTYLVNQWIDDTFNNKEVKDDAVLEPIRVSLYGMTNTEQITKAIDRQLHPFLYTKAVKIGANILKIAGKVVFRTDFDFNSDGKNDATLSTSLDSLSFLASKDEDIKPDSLKLLVFDDLERSHIPMKQLLGYINYFVEYCGCHVIIVGDESKITDEKDKKTLEDFKEKTVGKEFQVQPDIEAAISLFIDELPRVEWIESQKSFIKNVFVSSQSNNLRILRQCLYEFKLQYNEANETLLQNDKVVMKTLLGSFIAVYCEYKGQNKQVLKNWSNSRIAFMFSKEDTPEKKAASELSARYNAEKLDGINVLNDGHIANIVEHIERGFSMKAYIDNLLNEDQKVEGVLNRLAGFRDMEDDVFKRNCDELAQELLEGKYWQFYPIGKALAFFSLFEKENLYQVEESVIEKAKETLQNLFDNAVNDAEVLYQCRAAFWQGMNTVENRSDEYRIHNEMAVFIKEAFEVREKALPDKMQQALNNLSDENVKSLFVIDESTTPDHHSSYSHTSILKEQDADLLFDRIKRLSNANVRLFALFLSSHFALNYSLGGSYMDRFQPDEDTVKRLKELTENELEVVTGIRMWAFKYLDKVLEGCLKRCEGERNGLTQYM